MRFFKEENFKIQVDPEVKVISEFRKLLAKDKDRNKREAVKWFAYIYYMNDYRSPYLNYPKAERKNRVVTQLELDANFKEFKELDNATKRYLKFQETAAVRSLKSIREGLVTSSRVIQMLTDRTEKMLDNLNKGDHDTVEAIEQVDAISKGVARMLELSDKIPKAISTITALEEEVKKEQASDVKLRGGGKKGAFED